MGAAMQGGVGGHAGFLATPDDVAKIMQSVTCKKWFDGGKSF